MRNLFDWIVSFWLVSNQSFRKYKKMTTQQVALCVSKQEGDCPPGRRSPLRLERGHHSDLSFFNAFRISSVCSPRFGIAFGVSWECVLSINRGAGAACKNPSAVVHTLRAFMWASCWELLGLSTGDTHASLCSNSAIQCCCECLLKICSSLLPSVFHSAGFLCWRKSVSLSSPNSNKKAL